MIESPAPRILRTVGLVVLIVAVVSLILLDATRREVIEAQAVTFDSAEWRRVGGAPGQVHVRQAMAKDIDRRGLLAGLSRARVEALLGPPDAECWSDRYPFPGWDCGRAPGSSDGTALIVEFSPDGRAVRVVLPWRGYRRSADAR